MNGLICEDSPQDCPDPMEYVNYWGVYPEIAARLGTDGGYAFDRSEVKAEDHAEPLGLEGYIAYSFASYDALPRAKLTLADKSLEDYQKAYQKTKTMRKGYVAENTDIHLPQAEEDVAAKDELNHSFTDAGLHKPIAEIKTTDKLFITGGLFAAGLAEELFLHGYKCRYSEWLEIENIPHHTAEAEDCRFLMTPHRFKQLFECICDGGDFGPHAALRKAWFFDALLMQSPDRHAEFRRRFPQGERYYLTFLRQALSTADIVLFLPETVEAGIDMQRIPPHLTGTKAGANTKKKIFTQKETIADLYGIVRQLKHINPRARFIMGIAPSSCSFCTSNQNTDDTRKKMEKAAYASALLRVGAESLRQRYNHVLYFPLSESVHSFSPSSVFHPDKDAFSKTAYMWAAKYFMEHFPLAGEIKAKVKKLHPQAG